MCAEPVFTPVRDFDFNPVELLFAFVKGVIRRNFPRDVSEVGVDEMVDQIDRAFGEVTLSMVQGWLRYGCYVVPDDPDSLEAISSNKRCGYTTHFSLDSMFEDVIKTYEQDFVKKAKNPFPSDIHRELVQAFLARDAPAALKARNRFACRIETILDAFNPTLLNLDDAPITEIRYDGARLQMGSAVTQSRLTEIVDPMLPIEIQNSAGDYNKVDAYLTATHEEFDRRFQKLFQQRDDPVFIFKHIKFWRHCENKGSDRIKDAFDAALKPLADAKNLAEQMLGIQIKRCTAIICLQTGHLSRSAGKCIHRV